MATTIRPRRLTIAAGALTLALAAPLVTVPGAPLLPAALAVTASDFNQRYTTENFWNKNEAAVEGLTLQAGDQVKANANTIFNWRFRNDNGTLVLIRPQSPAAFKTGDVDIPVRVTPASGSEFTTTLKVNVDDTRVFAEWENSVYPVDFGGDTSTRKVEGLTLPQGVSISKSGAALPTGWTVTTSGDSVYVAPPASFRAGLVEIPVRTNGKDQGQTLRIDAQNPKGASSVVGGIIDVLTGGKGLNNGKGFLEGLVNASVENVGNNNGNPNIVITDNVNPKVDIRDNLSNNGNPVITNNANPNVEIKDNLSNNGNPIITNNANPTVNVEIKDNGSNNGSNNSAVITGNANPVVTGNANNNGNNNGSNNSADVRVTGNANPNVVITGNANPVVTGNANNNGSNNSADVRVTGNANPTVVITGNANNNGSGNSVDVRVTDNANGGLFGRKNNNGQAGDGTLAATGGLQDPRCIASLVGLGIPVLTMIPVALAQTLNIPALGNSAAIAAEAFDQIALQFGFAPAQVTAFAGGLVGVALAATIAAAAYTCTPKAVPTPTTVTTQVVVTEPKAAV